MTQGQPGKEEGLDPQARLLAFGGAIRNMIQAGEALSMFSPSSQVCDAGVYRREAEAVRFNWDRALRNYQGLDLSGVVAALEARSSAHPGLEGKDLEPQPGTASEARTPLSARPMKLRAVATTPYPMSPDTGHLFVMHGNQSMVLDDDTEARAATEIAYRINAFEAGLPAPKASSPEGSESLHDPAVMQTKVANPIHESSYSVIPNTLPPSSNLREAAAFYTQGYGTQDTPEERARFYAEAHNRLADALAATPKPLVGAREALDRLLYAIDPADSAKYTGVTEYTLNTKLKNAIAHARATLKEDPTP